MQDRLTEIEIKLAHLEHTVHELSDALYKQQGLIDRLEAGYENLRQRMNTSREAPEDSNPADEKPPHY